MPSSPLYINGDQATTNSAAQTVANKTLTAATIYDPVMYNQVVLGGANYTFPTVSGNYGHWRYVKAWGQDLTIYLTNGTFILGTTQYGNGQYVLRNGDSVSVFCDGSNWWVI